VDVGHELFILGDGLGKLDLHVALRLANMHTIVLAEEIEQLNALLEHAIPTVSFRILKLLIAVIGPLAEQCRCRVFPPEKCSQSTFKGSPKQHSSARILLPPAIQIPIAIAAWAGHVLADRGVAIDYVRQHRATQNLSNG